VGVNNIKQHGCSVDAPYKIYNWVHASNRDFAGTSSTLLRCTFAALVGPFLRGAFT
jgi:hypothetical protein